MNSNLNSMDLSNERRKNGKKIGVSEGWNLIISIKIKNFKEGEE